MVLRVTRFLPFLLVAGCSAAPSFMPHDTGPPPAGAVGRDGGRVDRLFFAVTGDTRPAECDAGDRYPRATFSRIASSMRALGVQFALDLGDHMFVCSGSQAEAQRQMGMYLAAIAEGPATFWMTMGNHECGSASSGGGCSVGDGDANFAAYLSALGRPRPWYANDVSTSRGLARFVVIADDAWNSEQAAWLEETLAAADAHARYLVVARHHPLAGSRSGQREIVATIARHRPTLVLSAHAHTYARDSERSVVVGLGGAPSSWPPGFATVLETTDGALTFVLRDATGNPTGDAWSVLPP